jgi:hypothetical protein
MNDRKKQGKAERYQEPRAFCFFRGKSRSVYRTHLLSFILTKVMASFRSREPL